MRALARAALVGLGLVCAGSWLLLRTREPRPLPRRAGASRTAMPRLSTLSERTLRAIAREHARRLARPPHPASPLPERSAPPRETHPDLASEALSVIQDIPARGLEASVPLDQALRHAASPRVHSASRRAPWPSRTPPGLPAAMRRPRER